MSDTEKILATVGDRNYVEHGGGVVWENESFPDGLLHVVEFNYWEHGDRSWSDEELPKNYTIYEIELEKRVQITTDDGRIIIVTEYIAGAQNEGQGLPLPIGQYDEWWHKYLEEIAKGGHVTVKELREAFCSDDVQVKAWAWYELGQHVGMGELDPCEMTLKEHEFHEWHGTPEECECEECSDGHLSRMSKVS